ncbi:Serine/Threonine-Protein Kinase Wnk1 [Manis pentadactyla]|nr:Serine/Threonine-Protein Kinase Wnk1 [Manis pentadactyla]
MVTSSSGWGAQDFRKCVVSPIGDGIHAVDSRDPPNRLAQTLTTCWKQVHPNLIQGKKQSMSPPAGEG